MPSREFEPGDRVIKTGGDYTYEGEVVLIGKKRDGVSVRVIVENDCGQWFIFRPSQLTLVETPNATR